MFVVWRSRERELVYLVRHSARLVESVRVNGQPRQRFVAFLGSFEDASDGRALNPSYMVEQRVRFWRNARDVLDGLGERITAGQRRDIEAALVRRVKPPTPAQIHKQWEEGRSVLMMALGLNPSDPQLRADVIHHMNSKPAEA
jgi:hypothetical protein